MNNQELYGGQSQKSQSIKFVVTTVLVALVVLGIAVWGIVFTVSNSKDKPAVAQKDDATSQDSDDKNNNDTKNQEVVEVTDLGDATGTTEGASAAQSSSQAAQSSQAIPKTGPEDILPFALFVGVAIAYLGSRRLANSLA